MRVVSISCQTIADHPKFKIIHMEHVRIQWWKSWELTEWKITYEGQKKISVTKNLVKLKSINQNYKHNRELGIGDL